MRKSLVPASAGEAIVASRLLVLQSKRLLLAATENCLVKPDPEQLRERAGRLRTQTESAQHSYRAALLKWGSPESSDYWLVAYTKLIEKGTALVTKLRSNAEGLPHADRLQMATEVEVLEGAIDRWRDAMRDSMVAASA